MSTGFQVLSFCYRQGSENAEERSSAGNLKTCLNSSGHSSKLLRNVLSDGCKVSVGFHTMPMFKIFVFIFKSTCYGS
jgi:hypothetical protein